MEYLEKKRVQGKGKDVPCPTLGFEPGLLASEVRALPWSYSILGIANEWLPCINLWEWKAAIHLSIFSSITHCTCPYKNYILPITVNVTIQIKFYTLCKLQAHTEIKEFLIHIIDVYNYEIANNTMHTVHTPKVLTEHVALNVYYRGHWSNHTEHDWVTSK